MNGPEATTAALARLALDAASLRHAAIAHNIANARTPGAARLRVNFEEQLAQARRTLEAGTVLDRSALAGVRPALEALPSTDALALDQQMVEMAQNTLQYQSLLRALSRLGSIRALAVNDGRR